MQIKNYTPHELNFFRPEDVQYEKSQRKYFVKEGAKPIISIPSHGTLSARIEYQKTGEVDGVPEYTPIVKGIDEIPDTGIIVVSALYVTAALLMGVDTTRLRTISQPVYEDPNNPRPVGCLGLNRLK